MKLNMVRHGTLPSVIYRALETATGGDYPTTNEWQWEEGCGAATVDFMGRVFVAVRYRGTVTTHMVPGLMSALRERGIDTAGATVAPGPIQAAKQEP